MYVPRTRLGSGPEGPSALVRLKVQALQGRSIVLNPNGGPPVTVPSSAVHKDIGVMILRIGDFDSETALLDPLAKSLLQYCRLLLPDDMVVQREVRSTTELKTFWKNDSAVYSHIILVGHGKTDSLKFGQSEWVKADAFADVIATEGGQRKTLLSLCCETGVAAFGKVLSQTSNCQAFIGPFQTVHGAVASQFCQTFLAYHLLQGETTPVAFKHARSGVPGAASFRLWINGQMRADP